MARRKEAKPIRRIPPQRRIDPNGNGDGELGNNHRDSTNGNGQADGQATAEGLKSPLSIEEVEEFRRLLLAKRAELLGDVEQMQAEALGRNRQDASGDLSKVPIHMADVGTDNYEQEFTLGLIQSEQHVLAEINHALGRIANGTYGLCEATHKPIGKARLRVQPWARFCIAYVRRLEQDGPPRR